VVKGYFHPTFLYEALWCLVLAAFLVWLGRRRNLRSGQTFAAYVMGYPVGRIVIENMRTDSANLILGQRVNTWVSILVFLFGVYLWRRFGSMEPPPAPPSPEDDHGAEDPSAGAADDEANAATATEPKVDRPAQS